MKEGLRIWVKMFCLNNLEIDRYGFVKPDKILIKSIIVGPRYLLAGLCYRYGHFTLVS